MLKKSLTIIVENMLASIIFVVLLVGAGAFFGKNIVWTLKFPLFFLFFSIPAGDFLVPYLQFITADISVYMLTLLITALYI